MDKNDFNSFKKTSRDTYRKIRFIYCPAFQDEVIHFTGVGFQHLIRKGRVSRKQPEQIERIGLIPLAINILQKTKTTDRYRINIVGDSIAHFWLIKSRINGISICVIVIVRRLNHGHLHFFSVFEEK